MIPSILRSIIHAAPALFNPRFVSTVNAASGLSNWRMFEDRNPMISAGDPVPGFFADVPGQ